MKKDANVAYAAPVIPYCSSQSKFRITFTTAPKIPIKAIISTF